MRPTRKLIRMLALVAVVALVAAGCDGEGEEAESPSPTTPAEATPQFEGESLLVWADETRAPVLQPFADQFEEATGVSVEIQQLDFGQIRDQWTQAGPAGEGPDVAIGAHDWLGQLVSGGVVAPIDLPNASDFLDVAIDAFTYEGQLYGVPYAIENVALIRNTDLAPEAPATLEELVDTALEVTEGNPDMIPIGLQEQNPELPADDYHNYPLYTAVCGCTVFEQNPDGTYDPDALTLATEGGLEAAKAFSEWAAKGFIQQDVTYEVMVTKFGEGNAPFAITGPWAITNPDPPGFEATGVPYVVEAIPPATGGDTYSVVGDGMPRPFVGVQGFMISSFAKNPLVAQTFVLDYITTPEVQDALFEAGGRPPALRASFDAAAAADPDVAGFGESGAAGAPMPAIPEMGSVWSAWANGYGLIFQGRNPEKAFEDAAAQIETLIAEGG